MEDPSQVRAIGVELRLAAQAGDLELRGIIDRLDLDDDGELIVTDYKTGRPPWPNRELHSLGAVHFYAFLCEQVLGRLPKAIRLVYLRDGVTITAHPSPQSVRFVTTKAHAVWRAIDQACATDGFEPHPSSLCSGCGFQRWCPAFGGDPSRAATELLVPA
jgi:putative RecB family exonuclease